MTSNTVLESPMAALAKKTWQTILVTGLLAVVLGIIVLVWPGPSLLVAGILFGIYMVVSGIFQLVAAFTHLPSTSFRVLSFISGVLSLIIGVFCFRDDLTSIVLLGLFIGISWLFRGIAILFAAASEKGVPGRGWQIFYGVISAIAGVILIVWPISSLTTLTLVVGIFLIVIGVMEMITAFGVRKDAHLLDEQVVG
ncbi:HdeD family acid-resistance protein [Nocardia rhizosphaerihabitans]|uniref:Membrane protein n=1 Tax=Nocardia rhizosphaerihabitans TaxID=1691570 RepID=A0ABQ2K2U6_9NOCA|nr:HdeD family acid-resistance protein [Nocardia rhizosphaerihabitans]GGN66643.1 membrane protein [Nocardia rhizosphaerihabitans]